MIFFKEKTLTILSSHLFIFYLQHYLFLLLSQLFFESSTLHDHYCSYHLKIFVISVYFGLNLWILSLLLKPIIVKLDEANKVIKSLNSIVKPMNKQFSFCKIVINKEIIWKKRKNNDFFDHLNSMIFWW